MTLKPHWSLIKDRLISVLLFEVACWITQPKCDPVCTEVGCMKRYGHCVVLLSLSSCCTLWGFLQDSFYQQHEVMMLSAEQMHQLQWFGTLRGAKVGKRRGNFSGSSRP